MQTIKYIARDTVKHDDTRQTLTAVTAIVDGVITNIEVACQTTEAWATQLIGYLTVQLILDFYEQSLLSGIVRSDLAEKVDIADDVNFAYHMSEEVDLHMLMPLDKTQMVMTRRRNCNIPVEAGQTFTLDMNLEPILATAFGATGEMVIWTVLTQKVFC